MIHISLLKVTQPNIRNVEYLRELINYVEGGGIFSQRFCEEHTVQARDSQLISIDQFPDDQFFLRNGHHRVLAMRYAGRWFLNEYEYVITKRPSYEMFSEVNLAVGWVTPFDPRTHLRLPDFMEFKKKVLAMPEKKALKYIKEHPEEYKMPRKGIDSIYDKKI
jgi:hypothetical protein